MYTSIDVYFEIRKLHGLIALGNRASCLKAAEHQNEKMQLTDVGMFLCMFRYIVDAEEQQRAIPMTTTD